MIKTTMEFPETLFRRAKARAAEERISLRQLVTEAVQARLENDKPDIRALKASLGGRFKHRKHEIAEINARIEREFERIDEESF
jgi:hypothetical protein